MNKVIVIGCPGSGKSTFSRQLNKITGLPLVHLDMLNWNPDRTTVPKVVFRERLLNAINQDSWIIDGNYGSTMELRFKACDTVIFLDYPIDICLEGVRARRGKPRADMPWIEPEDEEDQEFMSFIESYNADGRPEVLLLLKKYGDKNIVVFKNRDEADEYLRHLCSFCYLSPEDKKWLLAENEYWSVYLAHKQDYIGRSMVVLKRHCESLSGLNMDEWDSLKRVINSLETMMKQELGAVMFNWSCLMNDVYKQSEPHAHVHFHVRPRYKEPLVLNGNSFIDKEFGHHYDNRADEVIDDETKQELFKLLKGKIHNYF